MRGQPEAVAAAAIASVREALAAHQEGAHVRLWSSAHLPDRVPCPSDAIVRAATRGVRRDGRCLPRVEPPACLSGGGRICRCADDAAMSEQSNRANPKPPPMDRLSQLWRRINDYKVVQWSVAYVALAYGLQHGVILTSESLEWPNAVARVSMLLLALGLPLVMTCAWYHGMRASRRISGPELTIISILLVVGSLFFYVFVQPSAEIGVRSGPAVPQASVAAARSTPFNPGAISIAVLPFVNLSSDK